MDPDLLLETADRCRELGIACVADECFLGFLPDAEERSLIPRLKEYPELIVLRAITKLYAVPGLRLGCALTGNAELAGRMRESVSEWNVSIPAQQAGLAALKETEYVSRVRELIRTERPFLEQGLKNLGFEVYSGEANFLFFASDADLYGPLLERGILIRSWGIQPGTGRFLFRTAVRTREDNSRLLRTIREITG